MSLAATIRQAAERGPTIGAFEERWQYVNLGSWLGSHTPAWHAVRGVQSDGLNLPWFCHYNWEVQQTFLLIAAHVLDDEEAHHPTHTPQKGPHGKHAAHPRRRSRAPL